MAAGYSVVIPTYLHDFRNRFPLRPRRQWGIVCLVKVIPWICDRLDLKQLARIDMRSLFCDIGLNLPVTIFPNRHRRLNPEIVNIEGVSDDPHFGGRIRNSPLDTE